jgi:hypothetical protein
LKYLHKEGNLEENIKIKLTGREMPESGVDCSSLKADRVRPRTSLLRLLLKAESNYETLLPLQKEKKLQDSFNEKTEGAFL